MSLNNQYKSIKFKDSAQDLLREYYGKGHAEDDKSEQIKTLKNKIEVFLRPA